MEYKLEKAIIELKKAQKLLSYTCSPLMISSLIQSLITAMELTAKAALTVDSIDSYDMPKYFNQEFLNIYYYLRSLQTKAITSSNGIITFESWKNEKRINQQDMKQIVSNVADVISNYI